MAITKIKDLVVLAPHAQPREECHSTENIEGLVTSAQVLRWRSWSPAAVAKSGRASRLAEAWKALVAPKVPKPVVDPKLGQSESRRSKKAGLANGAFDETRQAG